MLTEKCGGKVILSVGGQFYNIEYTGMCNFYWTYYSWCSFLEMIEIYCELVKDILQYGLVFIIESIKSYVFVLKSRSDI